MRIIDIIILYAVVAEAFRQMLKHLEHINLKLTVKNNPRKIRLKFFSFFYYKISDEERDLCHLQTVILQSIIYGLMLFAIAGMITSFFVSRAIAVFIFVALMALLFAYITYTTYAFKIVYYMMSNKPSLEDIREPDAKTEIERYKKQKKQLLPGLIFGTVFFILIAIGIYFYQKDLSVSIGMLIVIVPAMWIVVYLLDFFEAKKIKKMEQDLLDNPEDDC